MFWAIVSGRNGSPIPEKLAFTWPPSVGDTVRLHDGSGGFLEWEVVQILHRPEDVYQAEVMREEPRVVVIVDNAVRTRSLAA